MAERSTIAILATLDTKGAEVRYLADRVEALGAEPLLIDFGVVGEPTTQADISASDVAAAGGGDLGALRMNPTRQEASEVMVAGASALLTSKVADGSVDALIGLGGTQGTSNATRVMQALPYGCPKVMLSTCASGDTAPFVGVRDITMMFSVSDLLGLNPLTRRILDNAAGAVVGMAGTGGPVETGGDARPVIGVSNLGVLTDGCMHAVELLEKAGCEAIVFHAVGSGGRAMETLMEEGVIEGVFDYALGEISDEVFGALRAGGPDRLTTAGRLGLPQVICPGGAEHVGLLVDEPNVAPDEWADHLLVWHNPMILAPRLKAIELERVAAEVGARLSATTRGDAVFMAPLRGTSRYGIEGGPLRDEAGDAAFFAALRAALPDTVEWVERDRAAEDSAFVEECVERLVAMVMAKRGVVA